VVTHQLKAKTDVLATVPRHQQWQENWTLKIHLINLAFSTLLQRFLLVNFDVQLVSLLSYIGHKNTVIIIKVKSAHNKLHRLPLPPLPFHPLNFFKAD